MLIRLVQRLYVLAGARGAQNVLSSPRSLSSRPTHISLCTHRLSTQREAAAAQTSGRWESRPSSSCEESHPAASGTRCASSFICASSHRRLLKAMGSATHAQTLSGAVSRRTRVNDPLHASCSSMTSFATQGQQARCKASLTVAALGGKKSSDERKSKRRSSGNERRRWTRSSRRAIESGRSGRRLQASRLRRRRGNARRTSALSEARGALGCVKAHRHQRQRLYR